MIKAILKELLESFRSGWIAVLAAVYSTLMSLNPDALPLQSVVYLIVGWIAADVYVSTVRR